MLQKATAIVPKGYPLDYSSVAHRLARCRAAHWRSSRSVSASDTGASISRLSSANLQPPYRNSTPVGWHCHDRGGRLGRLTSYLLLKSIVWLIHSVCPLRPTAQGLEEVCQASLSSCVALAACGTGGTTQLPQLQLALPHWARLSDRPSAQGAWGAWALSLRLRHTQPSPPYYYNSVLTTLQ